MRAMHERFSPAGAMAPPRSDRDRLSPDALRHAHEELQALQKKHDELRKEGKMDEANKLHTQIDEKVQ
jgi:hypothetical protein